MNHNKNKFWALIFGAILANSYVWIVNIGASAPVPDGLQSNMFFVFNYYSLIITALLSCIITLAISLIMLKGFNVCVSEHILWLYWPSLGFVVFTAVTANALLGVILQAVIPALIVLSLIYVIRKRQQLHLAHT